MSDAPVASEAIGDVIAKLNRKGNWVRGLELLNPANQFSLQRALAPYSPTPPARGLERPLGELKVTYDEEADAGFLYLPYASPEVVRQASENDPLLLKYSYSVEDESAVFGLGSDDSLVWIRFKIPSDERLDRFMELFGTQT